MSTQVLDAAPGVAEDEPDVLHFTCCDDDTAYCGEDVTGEDWVQETDDDIVCPMCAYIEAEHLPCTVPGCHPEPAKTP